MNRFFYRILFFLVMFALVFSANGIVWRDDKNEQSYIDLGSNYPLVGELQSSGGITGTGSLIHDGRTDRSRWVLTAAHITTPTDFILDGTSYNVADFIPHEDYDSSTLENDIALVELDTTLLNLTPMQWHDTSDDIGEGTDVISIGAGRGGDGSIGEESGTSGTIRGAENTISAMGANSPVTPSPTHFEYLFDEPADADAREFEGMAVKYDSGGPVVAEGGPASGRIVGVHSYVNDNDNAGRGTYGDETGSTQVALYDSWITQTVPEPTMGLFFVFAGGLWWLRRRILRYFQ